MATYTELMALYSNGDMLNKVTVAAVVAANDLIAAASPTAADKAYAAKILSNPQAEAEIIWRGVLAANKDNTTAQITGASDSVIQNAVDAIIPALRDALAGV